MGLHHFLYRCPLCGHLPLEKRGFRAVCSGCSRTFEQGEEGRVRVHDSDDQLTEIPASVPAEKLAEWGPFTDGDSGIMEASVVARYSVSEEPLHFKRKLLGFMERQGSRVPGVLRIAGRNLEFRKEAGESEVWDFLDIVALQASSSSIQISPRRGGVITFRFSGSSCRRWEEALKSRLRQVRHEAGDGEVAEFQPRIRSW
jgi:hypothetical protein